MTEVAGAIFFSIIAPVVFVLVSEYNIGRFPPVLCFPSSKVYFYTACVPLCIVMAAGVVLTVVMFWILREVSTLKTMLSNNKLCYLIVSMLSNSKILRTYHAIITVTFLLIALTMYVPL